MFLNSKIKLVRELLNTLISACFLFWEHFKMLKNRNLLYLDVFKNDHVSVDSLLTMYKIMLKIW